MESQDGLISWREYVDMRFSEQEKAVSAALVAQKEAVAAALAAADRAVNKADVATEKRFEISNEWRNTVETLQRTYLPRTEGDQQFKDLKEKIEKLTLRMNSNQDQKSGLNEGWGYLVGAMGLVAIIYSLMRGHL